MARTALLTLLFLGAVALAAATAHTPAPAPHVPAVVHECHDVCKDNCFQDIQTKCVDVPYQDQVCIKRPHTTFVKKCEKVCSAPAHGKKGLRRLAQASASANAVAVAGGGDDCHDCNDGHHGKGKPVHIPQPICHDVCTDVPVVTQKDECIPITKHRKVCKDHITNICKKVCTPVCSGGKGKHHL